MSVSSFIDHTSVSWKHEMLDDFFLPMDADTIRSIPSSTRRMDDFWAWHYEEKGILTVRSVYHLLVSTKRRR